jgi:hypothetical protein
MGTLLGLTVGQRAVYLNKNRWNGALVRLIHHVPLTYGPCTVRGCDRRCLVRKWIIDWPYQIFAQSFLSAPSPAGGSWPNSRHSLTNVVLELRAACTSAPASIVSLRISIFTVYSLMTTGTTNRVTILRMLPQETGRI